MTDRRPQCRVLLISTLAALVLAGCAGTVTLPDGTEMPESTYVALKSMDDKKVARQENLQQLMGGVQQCPEDLAKDEYQDCQEANKLWLVQLPWIAQQLDDGGADPGYWNLVRSREERRDPLRYVQAVNQTLQSLCITGLAPWGCVGYGGGGNKVKVIAKGENSSVNATGWNYGNKSPYINGDENLTGLGSSIAQDEGVAANRDGQVQTGDGLQGQAFTDPPNQPNIEFGSTDEGDVDQTIGNESSTGIEPL